MRKAHKYFIFCLLSLFLAYFLSAEEITGKSSIASVTIYPDRATVIREADLVFPSGTHSVVFEGLPSTLIPNSLRVSGKGTAVVKVLGIDSATQFLESALLPEIKKIQAEIESLEFEITKTKNGLDVLDAQEKFLKSIESASALKASQDITLGRPDIQSWEKILVFLGAKLQEIKLAKLSQQKVLKEQEVKLEALKMKLDSMKPQRAKEAKKVTVLLEASQAGKFIISLSYTVTNSRWAPLYTLRALPETSEIELSFAAQIQQKSGENWDDVKALLSTSSPAQGTNPPSLNPWTLDIYFPPPPPPPPMMRREAKEKEGIVGGVVGGVISEAVASVEALHDAEMAVAGIVESGLHLNFEVKRNVQIPSDGTPHKVPIDSQKMKARFDYFLVPKLQEAAFLRGNLKNTLPYPLFRGSSDLFIIQDFVGSAVVPFVAAGEEAKMFFGEDRQVSVKYEQLKKEKGGPGLFGKSEKLKLVYRISVQNFRKNPVEVEILDQLPISRNAKIEVKDININPQPSKKDEKGLLTWTITLSPQEKKEILMEFTIEYPKDARIVGI